LGDKGDIKDKDRFGLVKVRVPEKYHEALKKCADNWDICMNPLEGAREFCEYVKDHGYGIYVLSNASDLFYTYFPKFLPLDFFNGVFVSSDYLMLKPDVEIYKTFLKKYGLDAGECLFIDDRADNIAGAAKAGLNTFQFKRSNDKILSLFFRQDYRIRKYSDNAFRYFHSSSGKVIVWMPGILCQLLPLNLMVEILT
jgi:putative hydrolase of the HAD superfamily